MASSNNSKSKKVHITDELLRVIANILIDEYLRKKQLSKNK